MSQLTKFDPHKLAMPAYIASFFGDESNTENARITVPSLTYEGKTWTISLNGEKTKLVRTTDDGDTEPLSTMRVVVLDYAKYCGRAFYEGAYDPAKPGKPLCWSDDGIKPHISVEAKQSDTCESCPMSIKGSKINDNGKEVTACSRHRMLSVVPAHDLSFTPLRLKIAQTSDWDSKSPQLAAQGWFAWSNFVKYLNTRGSPHTARFVTKMRFDTNVAWPKIVFAHDQWLPEEQLNVTRVLSKSDNVKALLGGTWTPTGADGEIIEYQEPEISKVKPVTVSPPVKAAPPKKVALAPARAAEKVIPVQIVDEDNDNDSLQTPVPVKTKPPVAAKTKEPVKAPVSASVSPVDDAALEALLTIWDEEEND